ncbi:hypothetical protein TorRG33x02_174200 [Trema orientale]|uniref:RNase H type-1 domain-containing protein n=1 Tax=Trema orientale TaxID=63057 RepID=A0A2P5EMH4_TREOI|nr:hypothetical protein TorRG33x02_174200 [Trema orientale]
MEEFPIIWRQSFVPPITEAVVILLGSQLARDYAWSSVVIESDCLNLINYWNGSAEVPWSAAHILQRMRDLAPSFSNLIVSFVPRQCNFLAHNLVSWAFTCNSFGEFNATEVPESVSQDHVQWI